jgi:hypothetical protein
MEAHSSCRKSCHQPEHKQFTLPAGTAIVSTNNRYIADRQTPLSPLPKRGRRVPARSTVLAPLGAARTAG